MCASLRGEHPQQCAVQKASLLDHLIDASKGCRGPFNTECLWKMSQRRKRVLEISSGLSIGRASEGFDACLTKENYRLFPNLASEGMSGEVLHVHI